MTGAGELLCPSCGRAFPPSERFCEPCGMPLVIATGSEHAPSPRQERARKIKPQYTEGRLVSIARARESLQAEMIAGLLLEAGIPSMVRAGRGGLNGSREIFVAESAEQAAREALAWQRPQSEV